MLLDVGFEQFEVAVGEGVFRHGGWMVFHRNDVQVVVASLGAAHASVGHEGIHFACNVFGTDEDCCVVVEEGHKMVDARPFGLLVTDESDGVVDTFLAQLEDASEGFLHLDVDTTILSAQFDEKLIHQVVA